MANIKKELSFVLEKNDQAESKAESHPIAAVLSLEEQVGITVRLKGERLHIKALLAAACISYAKQSGEPLVDLVTYIIISEDEISKHEKKGGSHEVQGYQM